MHVNFRDASNVEVKSFGFRNTYDGSLEGSYQSTTNYILQHNQNKQGLLYLQPELVNGALKRFVYRLEARTDWEHRLEIVWYDDDIPDTMPLKDYIQQKTQSIDFHHNCSFFDLDNL